MYCLRKSKLLVFISFLLFKSMTFASEFTALVKSCEQCHGAGGQSTIEQVPILAGFSKEGFVYTIELFQNDLRIAKEFHKPGDPETVMNEIAKALTSEEVQKLAEYFSNQQFQSAQQQFDPGLASKGAEIHKKRCERCHSGYGSDLDDEAARLAGQWTPYLRRQFESFLNGRRQAARFMMKSLKQLSGEDIEALLNFYASQK